jgi:hypothetical protein
MKVEADETYDAKFLKPRHGRDGQAAPRSLQPSVRIFPQSSSIFPHAACVVPGRLVTRPSFDMPQPRIAQDRVDADDSAAVHTENVASVPNESCLAEIQIHGDSLPCRCQSSRVVRVEAHVTCLD